MKFRNNYIIPLIKNKKVLDLGFLGEDKSVDFSNLHNLVLKYSKKSSLGVDIHHKRIDYLKSKGNNVLTDDVTQLNEVIKLNKKFEVILCGELIEHVDDLGAFLDTLKKPLSAKGIIIITTPNIFSLRHMMRHLFLGQESPFWKDRQSEIRYGHVVGFSNLLLHNLILRKKFKIIKHAYTIKNEYSGFKGNLEKLISKLIPRLAPSLIYILKVR